LAKEFCEAYRIVEADEKLSSKTLSYKTKVYGYGRKSAFGATENALVTIKSAYDFLLQVFRWWISLYAKIVYLLHITALLALCVSMILSLISFAPNLIESTIFGAVASFMLSIPIIFLGWIISDKLLTSLADSLFNVRQQILGGIVGILPHEY